MEETPRCGDIEEAEVNPPTLPILEGNDDGYYLTYRNAPAARTVIVSESPHIAVDYDAEGRVVRVELLKVSIAFDASLPLRILKS